MDTAGWATYKVSSAPHNYASMQKTKIAMTVKVGQP